MLTFLAVMTAMFWLPIIGVISGLMYIMPGLATNLKEYIYQNAHPMMAFLIDFSLEFADFFWKIFYVVILFCTDFFIKILKIFFEFAPTLFRILWSVCQFVFWLFTELWNGLSGCTDKTTRIFSWIVFISFLVLYLERFIRGLSLLQRRAPAATVIANSHPRDNIERQNQSEELNTEVEDRRNVEVESRLRHNQNQDEALCVVCLENDRDTAIFPCGHTHVCHHCIKSIMKQNNKCPICLSLIREFRKVYV